ncbi:MAG: insulinase family protein [Gammaproteobacteria bacterium]|nr:insulinase family protein [Gammaproteobacteria bacterium]
MFTDLLKFVRLATALFLLGAGGSAQAMAPIQHWQTTNGARVYFVPAPELPMVDIKVVFNAGSARDGEHPGLAQLTHTLLDKGADGLSADRIAEHLEGVGARLSGDSLRDMATLGLRSLSDPKYLQPALAVFAKVLAKPDFNAADLNRERERMLIALQYAQQQPDAVSEKTFYAALYGTHPYASPPEGTVESLKALDRAALQAFYTRYYVAHNAVVAIVGAVDRAAAEKLAETATAGLASGAPAPVLPAVADLAAAREQRVAHPSTQTHVLLGQPGIRRDDPDYFTLYVGNYVLGGGGLVSRLSDEVREKRGLSYSVYSYFMPMAERGPFELGLQTRNDQAAEALKVLRETLARYVAEGPTAAELEAAQKNITGGQALRIDSNRKILEYLAVIGFYRLPLDYLETFNGKIEAVTLEQVRDAFKRRVQPERMLTVLVGGS